MKMTDKTFANWISQPVPSSRLALILLITCGLAGAMQLNLALASWSDDSLLVHWVWVASGVRLAAIMLFGWPGILGAILAFFVVHAPTATPHIGGAGIFLLGSAKVLGIWLALWLYGLATDVQWPWNKLSWAHVPFLALSTSILSELTLHLARFWITDSGRESLLRDVSLSTLGEILGIALFLVILLYFRRAFTYKSDQSD